MIPSLLLSLLLVSHARAQELPPALKRWMDYEQNYIVRTVDERKLMAPSVDKQLVEYRPETGKWFDLPSAWVPESELNVSEAEKLIPPELKDQLVRTVDGKKYYRLFVHPESRTFYEKFLSRYPLVTDFEATPTASSRSLLVRLKTHPQTMFFAKVSLNVELGGVTRTILRDESARGIGTAAYLDKAAPRLDKGFRIINEVEGIIPKGWSEGGQIIRLIPPEVLSGQSTLVPQFALYARKPEGSLIERLSRKLGLAPDEFVRRYVVEPFARTWADWAVHGPAVMEAHAQNVLMELGPDGLPTKRFFLRDLGGFEVDLNAPGFNVDAYRKSPVFSDFMADYYPKSIEEMQTESLSTYYEGGFLFNVDKELTRLVPGYQAGAVNSLFWDRIGESLAASSGLPRALFSRQALEHDMPFMIRLAEFHAAHPEHSVARTIEEALRGASPTVKSQGLSWLGEEIKAPEKIPASLPGARELEALRERVRPPGFFAGCIRSLLGLLPKAGPY